MMKYNDMGLTQKRSEIVNILDQILKEFLDFKDSKDINKLINSLIGKNGNLNNMMKLLSEASDYFENDLLKKIKEKENNNLNKINDKEKLKNKISNVLEEINEVQNTDIYKNSEEDIKREISILDTQFKKLYDILTKPTSNIRLLS